MSKLDELERLESAATCGPWLAAAGAAGTDAISGTDRDADGLWNVWLADNVIPQDAALIVALRNALPSLLACARLVREIADDYVCVAAVTDEVCECPGCSARRAIADLEGE